jgi:HAMP domain-containing protein
MYRTYRSGARSDIRDAPVPHPQPKGRTGMRFPLYPVKIGLAVCLPAVAALFLALFAVSRLDGLAGRSRALETARLPRADLAVAVERRLLLAAHAIRGYALTGEREALERAKKDLDKAADALHDAREAAARPGMEGLAAEAEKIGFFLDAYKKAAEASVVGNERLAEARAALAKAAETYLAAVAAFAEFKTAQWDKELAAKYPAPEALRQHARRLKAAQAAMDAGRDVREAAETARASRDPGLLSQVGPRFDAAETALRDSKGNEEDAKRLGPAFAALAAYRQAVTGLLAEWEALRATGRQILEAERAALGAASQLGGASLAETAGDAGALASSLSASRVWLRLAGWAVLLLGIGFAAVVALVLGLPVRRCATFAHDLSVGRLTDTLKVSARDEVGLLAASLREMARRLGKHLAR